MPLAAGTNRGLASPRRRRSRSFSQLGVKGQVVEPSRTSRSEPRVSPSIGARGLNTNHRAYVAGAILSATRRELGITSDVSRSVHVPAGGVSRLRGPTRRIPSHKRRRGEPRFRPRFTAYSGPRPLSRNQIFSGRVAFGRRGPTPGRGMTRTLAALGFVCQPQLPALAVGGSADSGAHCEHLSGIAVAVSVVSSSSAPTVITAARVGSPTFQKSGR